MIPAVTQDMTASAVAKGQTVSIPVTPFDASTEDVTAGATAPTGDGEVIDHVDLTISKVKRSKPIVWTGEEQLGVGGKVSAIIRDQYVQRMRALVNEIEEDVALEAISGAMSKGNVIGTIGTSPFASDVNSLTAVLKKLKDNGAPTSDLQAVINTSAGMDLRNIAHLQNVNEAGDNGDLLRRGVLGNLFGFNLRESAGFKEMPASEASGYLVNGKANKGDKVIAIDSGTGKIAKGTIVSFGSDSVKYVVAEDVASGATAMILSTPLVAEVADNTAVNTAGAYKANACFSRGSVLLATRVPAVPQGGDIALDRTYITDPVSGLTFEVALWGGAYQNTVTIATAWGCKNIKPEHTVALVG